jgi:thiamine-phosphate pyrophosphorylase
MLRYAITSRGLYPGDELQQQAALLQEAFRWVAEGSDFIQLREKDLPAGDIAALAREILQMIAAKASPTKILINSRPDISLATGAHGVHLTAHPNELTIAQVRSLYEFSNLPAPIITISCHTLEEVHHARLNQADAILFAPVFEKIVSEKIVAGQTITPGQGIDRLRAACLAASPIPVYALGGVTPENARSCLDAGAAGIAGIRLFHQN